MIGLKLKYLDKVYKFGLDKVYNCEPPNLWTGLTINMANDRIMVEGFACFKLRAGIDFEIEVAEIDEATPKAVLREAFDLYSDYDEVVFNELEYKLKRYKELGEILKNEGLI